MFRRNPEAYYNKESLKMTKDGARNLIDPPLAALIPGGKNKIVT